MSAQSQFICFLVALILFGVAAILHLSVRAWALALTAAGLAAWVFVDVVNAAEAM